MTGVWKRLTILHLFQLVFAYIHHTLEWLGKNDIVSNAKMDDDASGKIQILVTVSFLHPVSFWSLRYFFSPFFLFIHSRYSAGESRSSKSYKISFVSCARLWCDLYIHIASVFVSYARRLLIFHEYFPINCYVAKHFLLTHFLSINYMFAY